MNTDRFPADLTVTIDDFRSCGWEECLSGELRHGYSSMHAAFVTAASKATKEGRAGHGKVLWLLAFACSMMLSPDSVNEPFKPMAVFLEGRSPIPDDFSDDDILFFSQVVGEVGNVWLKARLADLVWLKNRKLGHQFALTAIDSYRAINLDKETWLDGGRECWGRAIRLALVLGKGADDRLLKIEATVMSKLNAATQEDGMFCLWLADMLSNHMLSKRNLGRDHTEAIAKKLESLAGEFLAAEDIPIAKDYYSAAGEWFKRLENGKKSIETMIHAAECLIKIAELSSPLSALGLYDEAIKIYRSIPRSERPTFGIDERIDNLRTCLGKCGGQVQDEMHLISTGEFDISDIVSRARESVRGKDVNEALMSFVNLHVINGYEWLRQDAIKIIQEYPLTSMLSAVSISDDGRVTAKRPGLSDGEIGDNDEPVIHHKMIENYKLYISLAVQGRIYPSLQIMQMEHRLREYDFVQLAAHSPIVPIGREQLFGKALFAGYDADFVTAIHLLVPQIEHMVRYHLKAAGAKTTCLDSNGIDTENGLSTLINIPEAVQIFGVDLVFELKALFCDALGPNLRNNLAHGLLSYEESLSIYAVYAWWLGLKLVFNTFWNVAHGEKRHDGGGAEVEEEADNH